MFIFSSEIDRKFTSLKSRTKTYTQRWQTFDKKTNLNEINKKGNCTCITIFDYRN
jgi:hypothetical protein